MATYNGARTIQASIDSILSQTHRDFELIVADDGSTDETLDILASIDDPRLRTLRNPANIGVVGSRNRCFSEARGRYVAMLDHDDLSAPTRLARQVAYLQANPATVLLGTAAHVLDDGVLRPMNHPAVTTPKLIAWLLHVANPLVCSSVMFRAEAAHRLGTFMRESFAFADDYEFYHRMATLGDVARLDDSLTIYRLHASNAYKRYEAIMTANAVRVLEPAYERLFGAGAQDAAQLVVEHFAAGRPVETEAALDRLVQVFDTLNRSFLADPDLDAGTRAALPRHAKTLWQRLLAATNSHGSIGFAALLRRRPSGVQLDSACIARMALDRAPLRARTRDLLRRRRAPQPQPPSDPGDLFGTAYLPRPPDPSSPPTLFVVVDTEAEFDWDKPFARELNAVTAMDSIERGQDIFDGYGLRPIYVIDYPVASQKAGHARLRTIRERDGCEIGVHLHPWTTPPFDEVISAHNSFPGNLDPGLEERKLATLMDAIRGSFGRSPVIYKAGRYGFGPRTSEALVRQGIKVDLSVLPGADLRSRAGPDFRRLCAIPYQIAGTRILSVPMTRSHVGVLPQLEVIGRGMHGTPWGRVIRVPSILAHLGLSETITLTPEGVTAAEQIRLLRFMLKRGYRQFVLHYHSPSLVAGHTPYVRDEADARLLLARLREVCRFFFEELGGLPGEPRSLIRDADRL